MAPPETAENAQEQSLLSHLIELRDRLLRVTIVVAVLFLILMPFAQDIYRFVADPLVRNLPIGQNLIAIDVASVFFVPYKLALLLAFILGLPYVLYQMWGFVAPGLYKHERRLLTPLLISSVALFYLGMLFAYYVVLPLIFSILPNFAPENVSATPDIGRYLDFVMMMFMAFGFGFEMPIATFLLITTGMISQEALAKKRPYVIVVAFIVGMLLTPPDVISQLLLAIPMWLLFELGLVVTYWYQRMRPGNEAYADDMSASEPIKADGVVDSGDAAVADADYSADYYGEGDDPYVPLSDEELEEELARIDEEEEKTQDPAADTENSDK